MEPPACYQAITGGGGGGRTAFMYVNVDVTTSRIMPAYVRAHSDVTVVAVCQHNRKPIQASPVCVLIPLLAIISQPTATIIIILIRVFASSGEVSLVGKISRQ